MATPSTDDAIELVKKRYEAAAGGDYFGVLGVPKNASDKVVQAAYFSLAKLIHPDKIEDRGLGEVKQKALTVFKFATEAKEVLTDKTKRKQFVSGELEPSRIALDDEGSEQRTARNADDMARIAYHKGRVYLNKGAYGPAEEYLRDAVKVNPNIDTFWEKLGWAIFRNIEGKRSEPDRQKEARECWVRGLKINDENSQIHYYMALYHKARNESAQCREALERAVFKNKKHVEANRELRLLKMRAGKKKKKGKNMLTKLMKTLKKMKG